MTSPSRGKSFLLFVAVLVLCTLPAAAQTATARVEGIVTDNTGAVLPGVTVTATNTGTNFTRIDVTSVKGAYTITAHAQRALPHFFISARPEATSRVPTRMMPPRRSG